MIGSLIIIHPALNIILWLVYFFSAMTCLSFAVPSLGGGWHTLNVAGKLSCIGSGAVAIMSFIILNLTVVLPM